MRTFFHWFLRWIFIIMAWRGVIDTLDRYGISFGGWLDWFINFGVIALFIVLMYILLDVHVGVEKERERKNRLPFY